MTEKANETTQVQIDALKAQYESNRNELLERISTLVCDITPQSHVNVRID
jgi:hypothetical protein